MQNGLKIHSTLAMELERCKVQLGSDDRRLPFAVTAGEVLDAHFLLADYFRELGEGIGGVGPKSVHLLQSAVSRQYVGFGGRQKWTDLFSVTATLFYGPVKNHAFHDANKRTALLTALYQLQCHNRIVDTSQKDFEELAVRVAEGDLASYPSYRELRDESDTEVRFIGRFFKRSTRQADKRQLRVTYRQLESMLARYGYRLEQSHGNRTDVVQDVEESYGLLVRKRRRVTRRITTIGFRDWGTEVSQKDLKDVRIKTELTAEKGYDSAVLMHDVNPMETLIAQYSGPLRRLARK